MDNAVNIRIKIKTKELLDALKAHPRETYNDVLERLIQIAQSQAKEDNQASS